jgi:hypothetical protein
MLRFHPLGLVRNRWSALSYLAAEVLEQDPQQA